MNYGFLIRNDRCIGCHACSTACKSENDVPLGVNRTWVKNVEKGRFPDVRRTFQVTRCNHCANPPCVRICPVTAMYQRTDGIVEFDPDRCIGCKACLQACPYDAIYIDPASGTAAKCHYCAHRTDLGLEPACVVVCPEHAIIAGDLDDPDSEIATMLAAHEVTVRKPEQGTQPKLFYVDGDEVALHPTATERTPASFAWADVLPLDGGRAPHGAAPGEAAGDVATRTVTAAAGRGAEGVPGEAHRGPGRASASRTAPSGTPIREPERQGSPARGPIHVGEGRMAGEMVRNVYNAQHRVPWHWPVPAYLVTKAVGAGLFLFLAAGHLLGLFGFEARSHLVLGGLSLLFTGATAGLLVLDLERPERFLRVLTRPQWGSWLAKGAYLLVAFSAVSGGWWILEAGAVLGAWPEGPVEAARGWILGAGGVLAVGAAVYTGYLFGQAEGRDLWQSPLLPVHLLVQALLAGSGAVLAAATFVPVAPALERAGVLLFAGAVVVDLALLFLGELGMPHASGDAALAARRMVSGPYRRHVWWGSVGLGHAVPLALLASGNVPAAGLAGLLAVLGLYAWEYAFVMAPQEIPNS